MPDRQTGASAPTQSRADRQPLNRRKEPSRARLAGPFGGRLCNYSQGPQIGPGRCGDRVVRQ